MSEKATDDRFSASALEGPSRGSEPPDKIIVCGGRGYTDAEHVRSVLAEYLPPPSQWHMPTIIHGGARGADRIAGAIALDLGFIVQEVPANWRRDGKAAGPIRNEAMLSLGPDLVIAFPGGKGTADMVRIARRDGVPVRLETRPKPLAGEGPNPESPSVPVVED